MIPEDLVNMYNIYKSYKSDTHDSFESIENESTNIDIKSIEKNIKKIKEDKDLKINNNTSEKQINKIEEENKIKDDFKKVLDSKYIKDCYDYILYKSRKFSLDKNNINYQKRNKGYKYRLYKCEFFHKNEAHYQKIKKIYNKNKNLNNNDSINCFCRGEIKYDINDNNLIFKTKYVLTKQKIYFYSKKR